MGMWHGWRKLLLLVIFTLAMATPRSSYALSKNFKLYIMTSAYGVIAGTITGVASLAFYAEPKDHLRNVAMGASIGLYVGILLGTYMVYAMPDKSKPKAAPAAPAVDENNPLNVPEEEDEEDEASHRLRSIENLQSYALAPIVTYDAQNKRGILGVNLQF
jgi:hypothetical protein